MFSKKTIFCLASVGLLTHLNAQNKQPNIILLTADDLGWNDISSPITTMGNGSKNHQTPNIDRLAEEGLSFTCAYTQQNSAPTRAALLTGLYANHTKVYNVTSLNRYSKKGKPGISRDQARIIPPKQNECILPSTTTFAEVLRKAGYETYIFGKVHGWKGELDKDHGFNHDFSCSKTVNQNGEKLSNYLAYKTESGGWIFDNKVYNKYALPYTEKYIANNLQSVANGNDPKQLIGKPKHFTDAIGDCVIDQLTNADKQKPFCMWVCFHAIHSSIVSRDDLFEKYQKRTSLDSRHENVKYAALTEQLDQTVGRILAALDDPNGDGDMSDSERENTIVLFMSDNGGVHGGGHSNSPLFWAKGTLYEGGLRTPLIVRYPGIIKPKTVSTETVHVIDYLPTLAEIAHMPVPQNIDGESFAGILTGEKKQLKRDAIYWHFPGYMDERQEPASVINKRIGDKRYKLRYSYEFDTYELYCLTDDIGEKNNLLTAKTKSGNLKIARNLRADLCNWLTVTDPLPMKFKATGEAVGLPREIK